MAILNTARLHGHPCRADDVAALRQIHGDPRAAATLSADGLPLPAPQTETFVGNAERHWLAYAYGVRVFAREAAFVGYCGLRQVAVEGEPAIELLYAVHHEL